ncbi:MAG: hypothetical protein AAF515_07565 [Pseudomonadota bacterium]
MTDFRVGTIFQFGDGQSAVIVKVLGAASDRYYCVYHQNNLKFVVTEFQPTEHGWIMSDLPGRPIGRSEWHMEVSKLKHHLRVT